MININITPIIIINITIIRHLVFHKYNQKKPKENIMKFSGEICPKYQVENGWINTNSAKLITIEIKNPKELKIHKSALNGIKNIDNSTN